MFHEGLNISLGSSIYGATAGVTVRLGRSIKQRKTKSIGYSRSETPLQSRIFEEFKEKPKRNIQSLMEHVEELEEYQNTLVTDSLHFVTILDKFRESATNEDRQLLSSMCEELR